MIEPVQDAARYRGEVPPEMGDLGLAPGEGDIRIIAHQRHDAGGDDAALRKIILGGDEQPATRRELRSIITARYRHPCAVGM